MKIAAIESLHWAEFPRLLVVRVHTDTGLVGLGETVDKLPAARAALHGTLAPLLLGQEALDIEGLWRFAMDNLMYHGFAGAETRALSALELALWDVMGQHYSAPLCHLLGGKTREAIPTYNTCIGFGDWPDYAAWHEDAGALARSLLADGISAMKIWPFDRFSEASYGQRIAPAQIEEGLRPIRQIREAVGNAMEIGIECHFRWNRVSMERIARALEPYDILFLEDALPAVYPAEIKALGAKTRIPLIGSELLITRWQLREWLEEGVTPLVMTDPVWNGGVGETRKIAARWRRPTACRWCCTTWRGPICHAACMHLAAHIPNLYYVESVRAFYRSYFGIISDFVPRDYGWHVGCADGAGLGGSLE